MKMLAWVRRNWTIVASVLFISSLAYAATPSTPVGLDNVPLFTAGNPGVVSGTVTATPTGTQAVNLTQVAGVAIAQGNGAAATAIRVSLPTDGTGVVGLNAGSAIIGNVRIDQTTPGTTNAVTLTGYLFNNITTATTTTVKSGAGVVHTICVNSLGTVASAVVVYDNTAGSGTKLATINSLALLGCVTYDTIFATGLTLVTTGTVAPDVTVSYR